MFQPLYHTLFVDRRVVPTSNSSVGVYLILIDKPVIFTTGDLDAFGCADLQRHETVTMLALKLRKNVLRRCLDDHLHV